MKTNAIRIGTTMKSEDAIMIAPEYLFPLAALGFFIVWLIYSVMEWWLNRGDD